MTRSCVTSEQRTGNQLMYEFRWLVIGDRANPVTSEALVEHPSAFADGAFVRVLQFRTEEGPRGEAWWGSWQDVPMVPGVD